MSIGIEDQCQWQNKNRWKRVCSGFADGKAHFPAADEACKAIAYSDLLQAYKRKPLTTLWLLLEGYLNFCVRATPTGADRRDSCQPLISCWRRKVWIIQSVSSRFESAGQHTHKSTFDPFSFSYLLELFLACSLLKNRWKGKKRNAKVVWLISRFLYIIFFFFFVLFLCLRKKKKKNLCYCCK